MKKVITLLLFLSLIGQTSCKKGYTYLNSRILCEIKLKDPLSAVGKFIVNGNNIRNYSFTSNLKKASFDYSDGHLYVSDNYNNRILKFDKSGKLKLVIYTDKPLNTMFYNSAEQARQAQVDASVKKVKYDIFSPSTITADSDGNIYVESYKKKIGNKPPFHFILKFDSDGKFLFKIGRDGRDGFHFMRDEVITNLMTDGNKNLYVISRYKIKAANTKQLYGIMIKVYNSSGKYLFKVKSHKLLSQVESESSGFKILENFIPAPSINSFLFSVAYYKKEGERVKLSGKSLYKLNYINNSVKKIKDFPEDDLSLFYVSSKKEIYLSKAEGHNLNILIMTTDGKVKKRNKIQFFTGAGKYIASHVATSGKILGMFYIDEKLKFYNWF